MGRKASSANLQQLKVPSFFRCPISLDVMKSPVSLCTGVTYDRSSIQKWLESGNNTCPATMQPLPSTDLIPNHTLHRLITLWNTTTTTKNSINSINCMQSLRSDDPIPCLVKLNGFFLNEDVEEFEKNNVVKELSPVIPSLFRNINIEVAEKVVMLLKTILASTFVEESNKQLMISTVAPNMNAFVASVVGLLKGSRLESRIDAATVFDAIMFESNVLVSDTPDLIRELIKLIGFDPVNRLAIDVGLSCLVKLSGSRKSRIMMIHAGIVGILTRILSMDCTIVTSASAEKAMRLMEISSGCADGREAICENAEETVNAVMGRMMKIGREGTEAGVVVLWSVCCLYRDRRAHDAVEKANGGLTKILLLMQSDCKQVVREMVSDLLKIFRVSKKSCLKGYDTKTTHIMPF